MTIILETEGGAMRSSFIDILAAVGLSGRDPKGGGYMNKSDVKYRTADGIPYSELWALFTQGTDAYNKHKTRMVEILTFPVDQPTEKIPKIGSFKFERATEYGVPRAPQTNLGFYQLAYGFEDFDLGFRYTWKFLRDSHSNLIKAQHNEAMNADKRLIWAQVMNQIFNNTTYDADIEGLVYKVYPLYNGDGIIPESVNGKTFTVGHNHYLVSGGAKIDSEDIEVAAEHIREHGFTESNGVAIVALCSKAIINEVRKFRMGVENNNTKVANYDFIQSENQPALYVANAEGLLGKTPPNSWNGLLVQGSYDKVLFIDEPTIPDDFVLFLASGGPLAAQNLVGFREHEDAAWRGLQQLPGNQSRYPLIDGFYRRSFGTGIRRRGGAVVMQIKASGSYVAPTFAWE